MNLDRYIFFIILYPGTSSIEIKCRPIIKRQSYQFQDVSSGRQLTREPAEIAALSRPSASCRRQGDDFRRTAKLESSAAFVRQAPFPWQTNSSLGATKTIGLKIQQEQNDLPVERN